MATKHSFGKQILRQDDGLSVVGDVPFLISNLQSFVAINSDNAFDAAGKEGARQIQIIGIDKTFNRITENIFLKGVEQVVSKKEYIFIEAVEVIQVGSLFGNQGTIRISSVEGLLGKVNPNRNRMLSSAIVVPEGRVGELHSWFARINQNEGVASATYTLCNLTLKNGVSRPLDEITLLPGANNDFHRNYNQAIIINRPSILYVTATTDSEGVEVSTGLEVSLQSN